MSNEHSSSSPEPSRQSDAAFEAILAKLPEELREAVRAAWESDRQKLAELQAENASYRKALNASAAKQFPLQDMQRLVAQSMEKNDWASLDEFLPELEALVHGEG